MKTFTICRQHPKAHKAVFCVCWNKEHYSSIQFEGETEALQLSRFTAEMNEQRSVPASPDTFSLFIQIAIKINHFCVFPFLCFWWTSSFFLSFSLPFFAISIVPFYSYALRLCESFTFNVYFCWKKRRKKLFFFSVDLCSLERYDFYFHRELCKSTNGWKMWKISAFLGLRWYLRESEREEKAHKLWISC